MPQKSRFSYAFTLIELLIVVAIIAILAAIAVPNFLEAQVRAKTSRAKNEMRAIATAMEAYAIDYNHYPNDGTFWNDGTIAWRVWLLLYPLTTPVAYTTSIPPDLFVNTRGLSAAIDGIRFMNAQLAYKGETVHDAWLGRPWTGYTPTGLVSHPAGSPNLWVSAFGGRDVGKRWSLSSIGPDRHDNWGSHALWGEDHVNRILSLPGLNMPYYGCLYDPTNGTLSEGDIVRAGP